MSKILKNFKKFTTYLLIMIMISPVALASLFLNPEGASAAIPGTPPLITSIKTEDLDSNGKIDTFVVTFDENIDDTSISSPNFNVIGYSGEKVKTGSVSDDNIIIIKVTEKIIPDTGQTPDVVYTAGTLVDEDGDALVTVTYSTTLDKAPPVIMSAETKSNAQINVTFSENLRTTSVQAADFAIVGNNVTTVSSVNNPIIELLLGTPISGGETPQVSIQAGRNVNDLNSNKLSGPIDAPTTIDGLAPSIMNVSSSLPDGMYGIGSVVDIAVKFDEIVVVDTTLGTPKIVLETGTIDRDANYISGSGTDELVFSYIVEADDINADLNYVDKDSLYLDGGTIKDGSGNDADIELPVPGALGSLSDNKDIEINTQIPITPQINASVDDKDINVSFKGVGGGVNKYQIYINGILSRSIAVVGDDTGVDYTRKIEVGAYGQYQIQVNATNVNGTSSSSLVSVEAIAPQSPVITASAVVNTPVTPAVSSPQVTTEKESTVNQAPVSTDEPKIENDDSEKKVDEQGQIKGEEEENGDNEDEKINWTPWIILFILIILAGAATGGYFYWFGEEEEVSAQVDEAKKVTKKKTTNNKQSKKKNNSKSRRW